MRVAAHSHQRSDGTSRACLAARLLAGQLRGLLPRGVKRASAPPPKMRPLGAPPPNSASFGMRLSARARGVFSGGSRREGLRRRAPGWALPRPTLLNLFLLLLLLSVLSLAPLVWRVFTLRGKDAKVLIPVHPFWCTHSGVPIPVYPFRCSHSGAPIPVHPFRCKGLVDVHPRGCTFLCGAVVDVHPWPWISTRPSIVQGLKGVPILV